MTQVELEYEGDHIWSTTMRYRGHTAGMIRRVGKETSNASKHRHQAAGR